MASLLLLYLASSAPTLMSRSSGRSCARSRHSSCPPSGNASPSAVLSVICPTSPSYIKRHCPTGSLGREGMLYRLACFVVRHSGYMRDGLRWGRSIYPCLCSWCKTHHLYYFRPRQHMTVPRKISIHTTREESLILISRKELIVGTVHKPRQGGINSVPLL